MRPEYWHPPRELNASEEKIVKRIKRAKLFTFLREIRHQLFNDEFQEELNKLYADANKGKPPVPPAKIALVTILQAYTGASDAEAIEALIMDRRWQLVLDCLDCEQAPLSQATLVRFRNALIIQGLDRRLIERTVGLAEQTRSFGSRQLRAALDSSPLWGASKVEDTYNLMGHALKKALGVISNQQGRGLMEIAQEIGVDIIAGSSLKAALDLNWDEPEQKNLALRNSFSAFMARFFQFSRERNKSLIFISSALNFCCLSSAVSFQFSRLCLNRRTNRLDELFNSFINHQFFGDILRHILCLKKYHLKTPKVNTLEQRLYEIIQEHISNPRRKGVNDLASIDIRKTTLLPDSKYSFGFSAPTDLALPIIASYRVFLDQDYKWILPFEELKSDFLLHLWTNYFRKYLISEKTA